MLPSSEDKVPTDARGIPISIGDMCYNKPKKEFMVVDDIAKVKLTPTFTVALLVMDNGFSASPGRCYVIPNALRDNPERIRAYLKLCGVEMDEK